MVVNSANVTNISKTRPLLSTATAHRVSLKFLQDPLASHFHLPASLSVCAQQSGHRNVLFIAILCSEHCWPASHSQRQAGPREGSFLCTRGPSRTSFLALSLLAQLQPRRAPGTRPLTLSMWFCWPRRPAQS